ncbi:6-hydroxy-d-nicotine oxidase [Trichoderma arundinaceum]|uniref:6-hydroxy-d-nicotine oxidase n=1 Tax=Trichoderma arundinaceum TaxID=490622 RepID=A0A395NGP4_TRIAR|nr:6-hydroxy-d-nicotine oxidase [Trichoderma arundinaceum]
MSTWFQNNTCTPFTDPSTPCDLGNYAAYSIDVRSASDAQAGLQFARSHNIRLVIKNSGHDVYGKSTGKGALSLWVHNLQSKTFIPSFSSSFYKGPAVKIGAGVSGSDASSFVSSHGYRIVAGSCGTVKPAGGYTQGGGHSLLSGIYGFGADNVLQWEVVTADGRFLTATPVQNTDLYWALGGGGGGTFAVVLSMTVRVFPDGGVASAGLQFDVSRAGSVDKYWDAVQAFEKQLQPLVDDGMVAEYAITNNTLTLGILIAPGFTSDSLTSSLSPLLGALANVSPTLTRQSTTLNVSHWNTYIEMYESIVAPPLAAAVFPSAFSGRFLPRKVVESKPAEWYDALRTVVSDGRYYASCVTLNALNKKRNQTALPIASNAVQPNFKTAFSSIVINPAIVENLDWPRAQALQNELQNEIMPILEKVTPGAGAYKNEANWAQKDFQEAFYGGTYPKLIQIKQKWDPEGILYALTGVGSEKWVTDGDGRLCPV